MNFWIYFSLSYQIVTGDQKLMHIYLVLNFATDKCEWRHGEATNESWNIYISFSEDYWSKWVQNNKNKQKGILHFADVSLTV